MSDYFNKYDKVRYFYCFFINFHRMIKSVNVLLSDISQYPDILFYYCLSCSISSEIVKELTEVETLVVGMAVPNVF